MTKAIAPWSRLVATTWPALPVIVPHFGAGFLREALMAAEACPNLYLDTSSSNSWLRSPAQSS